MEGHLGSIPDPEASPSLDCEVIQPAVPFALPVVDLSGLAEIRREPQALALAGEEARRPFDLARDPMLRGVLLHLADEDHVLALTTADALWEPGAGAKGSIRRPVWIAYAGTELESQPFTANLRDGRKAGSGNDVLEIPKRSGHRFSVQKVPGGLITAAYLPELFDLEPAKTHAGSVRFLFAPPRWWISAQAATLASDFGDQAHDAARAALFCAFLDRRTPLPLVHDLRFHLQLYRAFLTQPWMHRLVPSRLGGEVLVGRGAEGVGLDAPLAVSIAEPTLTAFLIQQTSLYHQEEIRRGKTRIPAGGRLLPYPAEASGQLRLDFALA
jgi:hypothetical protein